MISGQPHGQDFLAFTSALLANLSIEELGHLQSIQDAIGEDQANDWLGKLMASTGRYELSPDGDVRAIEVRAA